MPRQMKQISTHRKSHILIVPSSLPDTNHFPSLLKPIDVTLLECPSKVAGSEEEFAMSYIYIFL